MCFETITIAGRRRTGADPLFHPQSRHHPAGWRCDGKLFAFSRSLSENFHRYRDLPGCPGCRCRVVHGAAGCFGVEAVTRTAQKISGGTLEERVPVKTSGDEIDQLALTFNQMLDRIQALLKEIKEMSDNVAHDLRSPITRIRGTAEVTLTSGKTLGEYESMAASTIEECDRLLDMINTMLIISKTESGVELFPSEDVDLTGIVRQACELFEPTAEDKKVRVQCNRAWTEFI